MSELPVAVPNVAIAARVNQAQMLIPLDYARNI